MNWVATRHSHAELFVHLVWTTKEWAAILTRPLLASMSEQIRSTAQKYAAIVTAFGGVSDHVHVAVRYRPDLTVSKLVQSLKAAASRMVRRDFEYLPDFAWQAGYGATSVSPEIVDRVNEYIANQESHHADNTIWPEFEPSLDD